MNEELQLIEDNMESWDDLVKAIRKEYPAKQVKLLDELLSKEN